jgi:hypothetical protein
MAAAREVGRISTDLYSAKRRGDLSEVQRLQPELTAARRKYDELKALQR